MPVRIGVVVFPGSNCDRDTLHALALAGAEPVALWHEQATLDGVAAVVLPGGFAYGDYVRAGVIARFSPIMRAVAGVRRRTAGSCSASATASRSWPRPASCPARCCATPRSGSPARRSASPPSGSTRRSPTRLDAGRPLRMPVAHGEGRYYADEATLDALERDGQVLFRYVDAAGAPAGPDDPANPNGSLRAIAGVMNAAGNVAGLMPHPERASEAILGSDDGSGIIRSLVESAARAATRPAGRSRSASR